MYVKRDVPDVILVPSDHKICSHHEAPLDPLRLRDLALLEHPDLGTLKQAAQAPFVTQPAVTQMLKGLSAPLDYRWWSAAGVACASMPPDRPRWCISLRAPGTGAGPRGARRRPPQLRLGATPSPRCSCCRRRCATCASAPSLRLHLTEAGVESLWRQLAGRARRVILGRLPGQDPAVPARMGCVTRPVDTQRLVLVCAEHR